MKRLRNYLFTPLFVALVPFLVASHGVYGDSGAVNQVVAKMRSMSGFRANVSFGRDGAADRGVLSYQGGKFHLKFSDGRVIASNGREVMVWNPATGVAGKQDILAGSGGAGWLLSGFDTRVNGNSAHLVATDSGRSIQEVRLSWNSNFVLTKLSMKSGKSDSWFTITISNLRPVNGFPTSLFSWRPPAGSRTVENPLNQSS